MKLYIKETKQHTELVTDLVKIWVSCDTEPWKGTCDIYSKRPQWDGYRFQTSIFSPCWLRSELGLAQQDVLDFLEAQIGLPEPGEVWDVRLI